ncbi:asparagine synthase C-terminal domain-containing protein [Lujinxingia litoralis]|nr:asparagine synthase C-terminal domain-containing protein [Lujinxingia litoralis]
MTLKPLEGEPQGWVGAGGDLVLRSATDTLSLAQCGGAFYQIAVVAEKPPGGWFCIFGPPTTVEALLDPQLARARRLERLHELLARVQRGRGLERLGELGAAVALRWDAHRGELSVRRDMFGRVPLVVAVERGASGGRGAGPAVSTRPALLHPWREPSRVLWSWETFASANDAPLREDFWPGVERIFPGEERRWRAGSWRSVARPWRDGAVERAKRAPQSPDSERFAQLLARSCRAVEREPGLVYTLSGGLDSSTLVALARDGRSSAVRSASMVSARHPGFDERGGIEAMVQRWRTRHRYVDIGDPDLWTPQSANPDVEDWGPVLIWEAPYMRHFFREIRGQASEHARTLVFGFGADQLLFSAWPHYLELAAGRASVAELRRMLGGAFARRDLRESVRILGSRVGLLPLWRACCRPAEDPRHQVIEGWKWEASMRAFERYRRSTGVRLAFPFLERELWKEMLARTPLELRWGAGPKANLRQILHHRAPDCVTFAPKSGLFDEVVAQGMLRLFGPGGVGTLAEAPAAISPVSAEHLRRTRAWLRAGAPADRPYEAAIARYATSFEAWLANVRALDDDLTSPGT